MKNAIPLLMLLVLVTACGTSGRRDVGPSSTPFVGGVTALSMEFIEGAPPDEVYDAGQYPFSINLQIENLGEDDVEQGDGYIEITGISSDDFGLGSQSDLKKELPQEIRGVVKNFEGTVLVGDTAIAEFTELSFDKDIRGNWDGPRVRANLCYNYETEATSAVCLKRDMLTNIDTKEICELNGEKTVYNSGAPIQVTKVHQTVLGGSKIQVQFEVSHVGAPNDRFYKLWTNCDDRSTNLDKDVVHFEVTTEINGNRARCTSLQEENADGSGGFVKLFNGKPRNIICTFDVGSIEGVYEKQITAILKYRYYQFIEKSMLVKDVTTGRDE